MEIQTRNFLLRQFQPTDLENVFKGLSHHEVIKYYGVSFATVDETKKQMDWFDEIEQANTGRWRAITSKTQNEFYGAIGFNYWSQEHRKADLGFWLLPEFWGKGVIKEVLPEMLKFGFRKMMLHRIEAEVETANSASRKLLIGNGFTHEGTKRECEVKNGQLISLDIFSLLETDIRALS